MIARIALFCFLMLISMEALAVHSHYCPENHGIIAIGMTEDQVLSACGEPSTKHNSNVPALRKVPVKQLLYTNAGVSQGTSTPFLIPNGTAGYGYWNVSTNPTGVQLQFDIVRDKIHSVTMNGSQNNAASVCGGARLQVGDPASKVYFACGSPNLTNTTYINEIMPGASKPELWIYQHTPFQPAVNLTFINGRLQSIE